MSVKPVAMSESETSPDHPPMGRCCYCPRRGKLSDVIEMGPMREIGIHAERWYIRIYLCRWHKAVATRQRARNQARES